MRTLLVVFLLAIGCAHAEPVAVTEEQRLDDFCKDPPSTGDWTEWCARRTAQRNLEVSQQLLDEQRAEAARADAHRRFETQQAVWNASQAPFKSN